MVLAFVSHKWRDPYRYEKVILLNSARLWCHLDTIQGFTSDNIVVFMDLRTFTRSAIEILISVL